ncbi:hypothetical protein ACHAXS_004615 [Conticribra weissflogii]
MIVDFCIECIETYDLLIERLQRKTMIAARRSNLPRSKGSLVKSNAFVLPPKPAHESMSRKPEGNQWLRSKLTDDSMSSVDSSCTTSTENSVEVVLIPGTNPQVNKEIDDITKIVYDLSPLSRKAASKIKQRRSGMTGFNDDTSHAPSMKSDKSKEPNDRSQNYVSYPKLPHAVKKYMSKCEKSSSCVDKDSVPEHWNAKFSITPKKSLLQSAQMKASKKTEHKAKPMTVEINCHREEATLLIAQNFTSQSNKLAPLERKITKAIKFAKNRKRILDERSRGCFNSSLNEKSHSPKGSDNKEISRERCEVSLLPSFPSEKSIHKKTNAPITKIKETSTAQTTYSTLTMKEKLPDDEVFQSARRREVLLRAKSLIKD